MSFELCGGSRRMLLLALMVVTASCRAPDGSRVSTGLEGRVDAYAADVLASQPIAGMSIAISSGSQVRISKAYGYSDLAAKTESRPTDLYRIGSIAKQFTAALAVMSSDHSISLDQTAGELLPETPPRYADRTLRQMLSHTGGIPDFTAHPEMRDSFGVGMKTDDLLRIIGEQPEWFPPGQSWQYSNSGYLIAGLALERAYSQPFAVILDNKILDPLGLKDVRYCAEDPAPGAAGYDAQVGSWVRALRLGRTPGVVVAAPINMDVVVQGMCATAPGLLDWTLKLQRSRELPDRVFELLSTPVEVNGRSTDYGLGLAIDDFDGHKIVGHGGIINGFVAYTGYFAEEDVGVALLVNTQVTDPAPLMEGLTRAIFRGTA